MQTVLHAGCGRRAVPSTFDGWNEVRFDIDPDVGPSIVGSITDMKAIDPASLDAVYSSHVIEHLFAHEVPAALREFRRVLKPEGFLILTCPDIQLIAQMVAQGRLLEPIYESGAGPIAPIDVLFGLRSAIAQGNTFMAHKTGFTGQSLFDYLIGAGFARVTVSGTTTFALWAVATASPASDERLKQLSGRFLPPPTLESLFPG